MNASIGRIVRYTEEGCEYAAIITSLSNDGPTVDLTVFRPAPYACPVHAVAGVAYDENGGEGTWHWPKIESSPVSISLLDPLNQAIVTEALTEEKTAETPVSAPPEETNHDEFVEGSGSTVSDSSETSSAPAPDAAAVTPSGAD